MNQGFFHTLLRHPDAFAIALIAMVKIVSGRMPPLDYLLDIIASM